MAKLYVGEVRFILIAADAEHHDLFAMTYDMNISFFSLQLLAVFRVHSMVVDGRFNNEHKT